MVAQHFRLDFRSGVPIYLQIVEQVQNLLMSGELRLGDQLPTVRQMAADLEVNFNTVARAYRLLDEAGLISTQQGRGTYILDLPTAEQRARLRSEAFQELTRRYLSEAGHLGYTGDEIRVQVERALAGE